MKFHWGHGIFVFLTIFVLSMAWVIYKSFQQDNSLVVKEYYPKGLEYQKQIDRIANTQTLEEKIKVSQQNEFILLEYPIWALKESIAGEFYFYRPSGDKGDFRIKMVIDTTLTQQVSVSALKKGKYIVKMDWKMRGKEYYQEEVIFIEK